MSKKSKQSGPQVTTLAATTLANPNSSATAKALAGSVISQANTGKQSGAAMESKASMVLQSEKFSVDTKSLAGSVLSQSRKPK